MTIYNPNHQEEKAFFRIGQKAIILNEYGEMLLLLRSQKSGNGGQWSLAGGGLEANEDPYQGLEREIREETQLAVTHIKPFTLFSYQSDKGESIVIIGYSCMVKKGEVILNWEHDQFKWVKRVEAFTMKLGSHARFLIERFES
ncbi:MAG TPA: NUDIX domain-containing protein [Vitreimonas sp.]|nr:NUDIX domain-containing protein [Vitreimonas sp.]